MARGEFVEAEVLGTHWVLYPMLPFDQYILGRWFNLFMICTNLGNILADQFFHIFIGIPFPGNVKMSKKETNLKFLSNAFMLSKLFAIVSRDGMCAICNWLEQVDHCSANQTGFTLLDFTMQGKARIEIFVSILRAAVVTPGVPAWETK
jgi:hypothetical protein